MLLKELVNKLRYKGMRKKANKDFQFASGKTPAKAVKKKGLKNTKKFIPYI